MSDDGLLGRAELERAFSALGDRLFRRGVVADLFIVTYQAEPGTASGDALARLL